MGSTDGQRTAGQAELFLTHQDFVLPGEVRRLAEQLSVGDSEGARRVSNQHRVVQPGSTGGRWHQVPSLQTTERKDAEISENNPKNILI